MEVIKDSHKRHPAHEYVSLAYDGVEYQGACHSGIYLVLISSD